MVNETKLGKLFTVNGKDMWRMISYTSPIWSIFPSNPTATFENVETKEQTGGAVGSSIINQFKELEIKG